MIEWPLPNGYRLSGIVSGLRTEPNRRDMALIVSDRPAVAAGVFTQNRVAAAPVQLCRSRLPRADARAVIVCSGNANACTGSQGLADAERMAALTAELIDARAEQVLVASTGVIGRPLPMPIIETGIRQAVAALTPSPSALVDAAHAILTTDTRIKVAAQAFDRFVLTGFAKGAAMIGPNLATMLGFLVTDAPSTLDELPTVLRSACDESFNCISVEGHTSTNDTVLMLANGSGPPLSGPVRDAFIEAVRAVCQELARAIAADAEGATHLLTIEVVGTRTQAEAHRIAKTVAESALVKTAMHGADPNWGRIVSAAGYAGVEFEERDLSLTLGPFELYRQGVPLPFDAAAVSGYLQTHRDIPIRLTFTLGSGRCTFCTCDLTADYVRLNADYTT